MASKSRIEWTELTWNPTTGCSKISPGCKYCYAEVMARRLKAMGTPGYENGFDLTLHEGRLDEPRLRKKPSVYFIDSMSDLFHEMVPFTFIERVLGVCADTVHTYLIVTKRAERMREFFSTRPVPANVWVGVTAEDREHGYPRIDHLRSIDAGVRFLSVEPLLESMPDLDLRGIHQVIVGGESGVSARPMHEEWVQSIRDQCLEQGVTFFFKQWGAWGADGVKRNKKENGRLLDGRTWNGRPSSCNI